MAAWTFFVSRAPGPKNTIAPRKHLSFYQSRSNLPEFVMTASVRLHSGSLVKTT